MVKRAKATAVAQVTYVQIERAMRERYPAGSHALLWEVANATGSNVRRHADAVAVGLWPSHGHAIEGFELKVSRGDWLRERAQPEKSAPVYRFCHHWWLLTPKGLVSPDELPPTWGLLEVDSEGNSRVKVRAPRLEPESVSMGFVAALLRARAKPDEKTVEAMIQDRVAKADAANREIARREREAYRHDRSSRLERAEKLVASVLEHTGIDLTSWGATDASIAQRMRIADALQGGSFGPLKSLRNAAQEALTVVDGLLGGTVGADD